jgi:protein phosphatase
MTKNRLEIAGMTDVGCVRKNNEDSMGLDEELGLMVVADGMGGHNSGEVASEIAVGTVRDYARQMIGGAKNVVPEGGDPSYSVRGRQLEYFIRTANEIIYQKGRQFPKDAGMGTTVVAALADDRSLTVAHVGDSRAYLYRNGRLEQLTEDHSLVGDQVKKGLISADQAVHSNLQNILTRALGADAEVKVDVADHPLLPGDIVLLASDGLNKMVTDEEVAKVLATGEGVAKMVSTLIEMSRSAGGVDNITVVCARVPSREQRGLKGLVAKLFGD